MSIIYHKGDLLESDCKYICHQVNCQGVMGSGIAKQMRNTYPGLFNSYHFMCQIKDRSHLLGQVLFHYPQDNDNRIVINMFSQLNYGYDGQKYTSYDAFWDCLIAIKEKVPKGEKIGFPYKIGCERGGGNWSVIYSMIDEILGKDYEIEIWKFEGVK